MLLSFTISTVFAAPTDTDTNPMADQYQEVAFVIAASEKTYSQAVLKAATLAEQSGISKPMEPISIQNTKITMVV